MVIGASCFRSRHLGMGSQAQPLQRPATSAVRGQIGNAPGGRAAGMVPVGEDEAVNFLHWIRLQPRGLRRRRMRRRHVAPGNIEFKPVERADQVAGADYAAGFRPQMGAQVRTECVRHAHRAGPIHVFWSTQPATTPNTTQRGLGRLDPRTRLVGKAPACSVEPGLVTGGQLGHETVQLHRQIHGADTCPEVRSQEAADIEVVPPGGHQRESRKGVAAGSGGIFSLAGELEVGREVGELHVNARRAEIVTQGATGDEADIEPPVSFALGLELDLAGHSAVVNLAAGHDSRVDGLAQVMWRGSDAGHHQRGTGTSAYVRAICHRYDGGERQ